MCTSADALFLLCAVSGLLQGPVACAGTVGELAESAPSWRIYRQEFLRTMAFGEWETYDHPVACESPPSAGQHQDFSPDLLLNSLSAAGMKWGEIFPGRP